MKWPTETKYYKITIKRLCSPPRPTAYGMSGTLSAGKNSALYVRSGSRIPGVSPLVKPATTTRNS